MLGYLRPNSTCFADRCIQYATKTPHFPFHPSCTLLLRSSCNWRSSHHDPGRAETIGALSLIDQKQTRTPVNISRRLHRTVFGGWPCANDVHENSICFYGPLSDTKGLRCHGSVLSHRQPMHLVGLSHILMFARASAAETCPLVSLRIPSICCIHPCLKACPSTASRHHTEFDTRYER